eukprot:6464896-Amphidinium_carterae.1
MMHIQHDAEKYKSYTIDLTKHVAQTGISATTGFQNVVTKWTQEVYEQLHRTSPRGSKQPVEYPAEHGTSRRQTEQSPKPGQPGVAKSNRPKEQALPPRAASPVSPHDDRATEKKST